MRVCWEDTKAKLPSAITHFDSSQQANWQTRKTHCIAEKSHWLFCKHPGGNLNLEIFQDLLFVLLCSLKYQGCWTTVYPPSFLAMIHNLVTTNCNYCYFLLAELFKNSLSVSCSWLTGYSWLPSPLSTPSSIHDICVSICYMITSLKKFHDTDNTDIFPLTLCPSTSAP